MEQLQTKLDEVLSTLPKGTAVALLQDVSFNGQANKSEMNTACLPPMVPWLSLRAFGSAAQEGISFGIRKHFLPRYVPEIFCLVYCSTAQSRSHLRDESTTTQLSKISILLMIDEMIFD